jgi:hypothetical protein
MPEIEKGSGDEEGGWLTLQKAYWAEVDKTL